MPGLIFDDPNGAEDRKLPTLVFNLISDNPPRGRLIAGRGLKRYSVITFWYSFVLKYMTMADR